MNRLQKGDFSDIRLEPCPHCGYFQSWLVKKAKRAPFGRPILYIYLISLFISLFVSFISEDRLLQGLMFFGIPSVLFLLFLLLSKLYNPNAKILGDRQIPDPIPPKLIPI